MVSDDHNAENSGAMPASVAHGRPNRFGLALGVLLLAMVAIVYLGASYYRVRPAGHPATAVFWFVVGFIILRTALRPHRVPQWFYYVWAGLVIAGMILWLVSTAGLIPRDNVWQSNGVRQSNDAWHRNSRQSEGSEWLNRVS